MTQALARSRKKYQEAQNPYNMKNDHQKSSWDIISRKVVARAIHKKPGARCWDSFKKGTNFDKDVFKRCSYCFTTWVPRNHSIKLTSKPKLTKKTVQLLKTCESGEYSSKRKFHRKLLDDFSNGCSKITVTCGLCGKKRDFKGQTRAQKHAQQESWRQYVQSLNTESVKVLSKKEKKKEKKKLRKKRGRDDLGGVDNAGLLLPGESSLPQMSDQSSQRLSGSAHCVMASDSTIVSQNPLQSPTSAANLGTGNTTVAGGTRPYPERSSQQKSNMATTNVPHSNRLKNILKPPSVSMATVTTAKDTQKRYMGGITPVVSNRSHKNKVKMRGQQLSFMLKKEQNKQRESTLSDFLCNL